MKKRSGGQYRRSAEGGGRRENRNRNRNRKKERKTFMGTGHDGHGHGHGRTRKYSEIPRGRRASCASREAAQKITAHASTGGLDRRWGPRWGFLSPPPPPHRAPPLSCARKNFSGSRSTSDAGVRSQCAESGAHLKPPKPPSAVAAAPSAASCCSAAAAAAAALAAGGGGLGGEKSGAQ